MMGEVRRIKVNKSVTKNKLLDYGFRYKENGDYRLYVPVYKWNDKTTIYAYFYINMEENSSKKKKDGMAIRTYLRSLPVCESSEMAKKLSLIHI